MSAILQDKDKEYIANTYTRFDVTFVKGEGSYLYDDKGKAYIDLGSGIAVNSFGLSNYQWKQAIIKQINDLSHVSNLYYSTPQVLLAEELCQRTGLAKVFFGNSGAEANEAAIKAARKYSSDKYGANRNEIITLKNSFHGRTIATLAATGQDVFHQNFGPFPAGFKYATANDIESVKDLINDKTCAIMLETIQGEGGVMPLDSDFILAIEKICQEQDILMIIDEVQTGNGRTGYLYSYMRYGIKPNIVTTAKGLAGGLPMGVAMFDKKCDNVLSYGDHGSTFGGNPIVASGALAILKQIDNELLMNVKKKEKMIKEYFSNVKNVEAVSGYGLMLGIKTSKNAKDIVKEALTNGVVVLTAKDKIRLLPALNINEETLLAGLEILKEVIAS